MKKNKILFAENNSFCILKLIGQMRFDGDGSLHGFIDDYLSHRAYQGLIIDLSQTTYIDSTHLGLLLKVAKFINTDHSVNVICIIDDSSIFEQFKVLHLDNIFTLIHGSNIEMSGIKEVPAAIASENENTKTILRAHEELIKLDEDNENKFKNVVDICKSQLREQ